MSYESGDATGGDRRSVVFAAACEIRGERQKAGATVSLSQTSFQVRLLREERERESASERVPYPYLTARERSMLPKKIHQCQHRVCRHVSTHVDIDMCRRKSLTPSNPDADDRRQGASGAKVWTAARTWVTKRAADSSSGAEGRGPMITTRLR